MPEQRRQSHSWVIASAVAACLASLAMGTQSAARPSGAIDSPALDRGRELVQRNCGGCHATGPTGRSPNPRSPPLRTLHTRYPIEDLAESMSEGLLNAHTGMPSFFFTSAEASDIMAYLTQLQTPVHPLRRHSHR